jgi:hypothetical protein
MNKQGVHTYDFSQSSFSLSPGVLSALLKGIFGLVALYKLAKMTARAQAEIIHIPIIPVVQGVDATLAQILVVAAQEANFVGRHQFKQNKSAV